VDGTIFRASVEQDLGRGFRYRQPASTEKLPTILVGPGLWACIKSDKTRRAKLAAADVPLSLGLHKIQPDSKMRNSSSRAKYPDLATDLSVYRKHYAVGARAHLSSVIPRASYPPT
jgi:hypothetical protein